MIAPIALERICDWLRHRQPAADGELLLRYRRWRDEAAFAALLDRHGPMVYGLCCRVAGLADADDVFQATFLMLARKVATIRSGGALAGWLHSTAYRLSLNARRGRQRRVVAEGRAPIRQSQTPLDELSGRELMAALHDELRRLPERYRLPLILCCLEGRTQDESATILSCSAGAVKARIERGRELLRRRLAARGLAVGAALGAGLLLNPAPAVARPLAEATLESARGGMVPPVVEALLHDMSRAFMSGRIGVLATVVAAFFGVGAYLTLSERTADEPPASPTKPLAIATDRHGDPLPPGVVARLGTTRLRPSGMIEQLLFSRDGKYLASWHSQQSYTSGTLTVWDASDGRELRRVELGQTKLACWRWLPNGRGFAVVHSNATQYVWEFTDDTAKPISRLFANIPGAGARPVMRANERKYVCFAISPDGKRLVGGLSGPGSGKESSIDEWELVPDTKISELPKPRRLATLPDSCSALFFTPDGGRLIGFSPAKAANGRTTEYLVVVWDAASGKEQHRLTTAAPMAQGERMSVAVSNETLALGLDDATSTVNVWDLAKGTSQTFQAKNEVVPTQGYGISAIAFTPDGQKLITAGRSREIKVWEGPTHKLLKHIPKASSSWIESLAVSGDGTTIVSAGQDGAIRRWDSVTGIERTKDDWLVDRVTGAAFSRDGKTAITFCADGTLRTWDATTGRPIRAVALPSGGRSSARGELAPDGRTLFTNASGMLKALDVATGAAVKLPDLPNDLKCEGLRLGADRKTLLAYSEDKVVLLDWHTGKQRRTFTLLPPDKKPGTARCNAADISPDGRWLVTLADRSWYREERGLKLGYAADCVLDLWNATTGEYVHRLLAGRGVARTVLYTAAGDVVLAGGGGMLNGIAGGADELRGNLNLIDPLTGRLKRNFAGTGYALTTALSRDGRLLFVGNEDGSVAAYETMTGQTRHFLRDHRGLILDVGGSHDGRRLIAGGTGMNALIWDISLAGAAPVSPDPTPDERAKLWSDMLEISAQTSLPAMRRLAAHPEITVALFRTTLKPAASTNDDALLDQLVTDLGNEKFAVREAAFRRLDELGERAVVGLRARLANISDAEPRARVMRLLAKHDPTTPTAEVIREARALEILEQINTPEARALLKDLSAGTPSARRTQAAAEALRRMEQ